MQIFLRIKLPGSYEQPIDSNVKLYEEIRKVTTGQGEDYPIDACQLKNTLKIIIN